MFISLGIKADLSKYPYCCIFPLEKPFEYAGREYTEIRIFNYGGYKDHAPEGCSSITSILIGDSYNFWKEAKSSLSLYTQMRTIELHELFSSINIVESKKQTVITKIIDKEKEKLSEDIAQFNLPTHTSKLYHIGKESIKILEEICNENQNYSRPGQYIRSVVEEYCNLPFIERERIFHKPIYDLIETACIHKRILKVKVSSCDKQETYIVYPYKIVPEPFHTQSYLVCYSRKENEAESAKRIASFSMARINMPDMYKKTFHFNKQEIDCLEYSIINHSPAYLVGDAEYIRVRLTNNGKHSYQTRLYSRPEKVAELSSDDIYVFNCTQHQAFNYFFSFGADAEVISPQSLRERFINTHKCALSCYNQKDTHCD